MSARAGACADVVMLMLVLVLVLNFRNAFVRVVLFLKGFALIRSSVGAMHPLYHVIVHVVLEGVFVMRFNTFWTDKHKSSLRSHYKNT